MPAKTKQKLFLILVILWMILIFCMSAQPADESTRTSLRAGRLICSIFVPHYRTLPEVRQLQMARMIDHPVRKAAHATEYAILGILLFRVWKKRRYRMSLLTAACYAATDEIHQIFVPGRSGQITDVMIDTCGAAVGLLIVFLVGRIRRKIHREENYAA